MELIHFIDNGKLCDKIKQVALSRVEVPKNLTGDNNWIKKNHNRKFDIGRGRRGGLVLLQPGPSYEY